MKGSYVPRERESIISDEMQRKKKIHALECFKLTREFSNDNNNKFGHCKTVILEQGKGNRWKEIGFFLPLRKNCTLDSAVLLPPWNGPRKPRLKCAN